MQKLSPELESQIPQELRALACFIELETAQIFGIALDDIEKTKDCLKN